MAGFEKRWPAVCGFSFDDDEFGSSESMGGAVLGGYGSDDGGGGSSGLGTVGSGCCDLRFSAHNTSNDVESTPTRPGCLGQDLFLAWIPGGGSQSDHVGSAKANALKSSKTQLFFNVRYTMPSNFRASAIIARPLPRRALMRSK